MNKYLPLFIREEKRERERERWPKKALQRLASDLPLSLLLLFALCSCSVRLLTTLHPPWPPPTLLRKYLSTPRLVMYGLPSAARCTMCLSSCLITLEVRRSFVMLQVSLLYPTSCIFFLFYIVAYFFIECKITIHAHRKERHRGLR